MRTTFYTILAVAIAMLAAISPSPATAQSLCGDHNEIVKHLGRGYDEATVNIGITRDGELLEVLTSEKHTWSIIVTTPEGSTCIIATGEEWEDVPRNIGTISPSLEVAENICDSRAKIVRHLNKGYDEATVNMGIAANGDLLEVLTSESRTWSILVTTPRDITCIFVSGEEWEDVPRKPTGPEA